MKYDSVKDVIQKVIDLIPAFRKLFYLVLDFQLLRQFYVKRMIRRFFPKNQKISYFDAGAGFGQYSYYIKKHWKQSKVLAVDIKQDYLESLKDFASYEKWNNFDVKTADLQSFVPNEKYDLITAVDILEHIEDDVQVMKNFKQSLKPGGKLIISVPSTFDESAKFVEEHFRPGYSREEMITKLSSAGFRIESCDYMYGFWGHLYWLLIMKTPLFYIGKNKLFAFLLPVYYLFTYPIAFIFMLFDVYFPVKVGTGLIVVAE